MQRSYLFIHQNFPGQFGRMAQELARQSHKVQALADKGRGLPGIAVHRYSVQQSKPSSAEMALFPGLQAQLQRANAAAQAMRQLKQAGYQPDVIIAHPGWGEALFCKDIWPQAKLVIFAEWFYNAHGSDANFDPEFAINDAEQTAIGIRLKNTVHLHACHAADAIFTPTQWQKAQLPAVYQSKTRVIADYIDTRAIKPNPAASVRLHKANKTFHVGDEVITFVNRNLEPYRGFHSFMRALPAVLQARPQAHAILVGGQDVSYGQKHPSGQSWKQVMLQEVGAQLPMERVHFVGKVPYSAYLNLLQVSACHVYLTYPFVLSWSCLESMVAGCAMVASNTPPVQEFIQNEKNGRLVDFFNVQHISQQVIQVLKEQNSPAVQSMRQNARQTVVAHCNRQTIAKAWEELFE